ncbi:MAG: hypothetical protein EOO06_07340 [Chitinophagaceae bacterium]|nr:MAG: hypothetical protein EOO06_07340 [Chitinophagaceae bacterium]
MINRRTKLTYAITCLCFIGTASNAQRPDRELLDSMLAIPQTLELHISSPQPRMKEQITLSVDLNYFRAHLFKTELGKFEVAGMAISNDENFMITRVQALEKGKQTIGPLSFNLNGTAYTTNPVSFEVIEELPAVDSGIWIRKVLPTDSTLCIIVEHRIPAKSRVTKLSDNSTKYWTEPRSYETVTLSASNIDGLLHRTTTNNSSEEFFYDKNGEHVKFLLGYSISFFDIIDRTKTITITRQHFTNLPANYAFKDIIIN